MQPWSQPLLWPHPSGVVACDPYFGNVVLLMGFEGANGSTGAPGMTDESPAAHGVATGLVNATISNTKVEFGSTSLFLNSGRIQYANSNDWNFGAGNFTLELWVNFNSLAGIQRFISTWNGTNDSNLGFTLGMTSAGTRLTWEVSTTGINGFIDINAVWAPVINQWYFITLDYNGTTYRAYVNGTMIGSSTTARTIFNSTHNLNIGSDNDGSSPLLGYMDELRITKGVARYASDSGFAVPTAAFPRVACSTTGTTATWNPADKSAQITLSGGNLIATDTSTGDSGVRSATSHSGGKWYIEWTSGSTFTGANTNVGICTIGAPLAGVGNTTANAFLLQQGGSGAVWFNGSQAGLPQIGQFFTNRIAGMAIDLVNMRGWFRVDGASGLNYWNGNASYDPATNTGGVDISALFPSNAAYPVFTSNGNGSICTINSTFTYAAPSGFNPW